MYHSSFSLRNVHHKYGLPWIRSFSTVSSSIPLRGFIRREYSTSWSSPVFDSNREYGRNKIETIGVIYPSVRNTSTIALSTDTTITSPSTSVVSPISSSPSVSFRRSLSITYDPTLWSNNSFLLQHTASLIPLLTQYYTNLTELTKLMETASSPSSINKTVQVYQNQLAHLNSILHILGTSSTLNQQQPQLSVPKSKMLRNLSSTLSVLPTVSTSQLLNTPYGGLISSLSSHPLNPSILVTILLKLRRDFSKVNNKFFKLMINNTPSFDNNNHSNTIDHTTVFESLLNLLHTMYTLGIEKHNPLYNTIAQYTVMWNNTVLNLSVGSNGTMTKNKETFDKIMLFYTAVFQNSSVKETNDTEKSSSSPQPSHKSPRENSSSSSSPFFLSSSSASGLPLPIIEALKTMSKSTHQQQQQQILNNATKTKSNAYSSNSSSSKYTKVSSLSSSKSSLSKPTSSKVSTPTIVNPLKETETSSSSSSVSFTPTDPVQSKNEILSTVKGLSSLPILTEFTDNWDNIDGTLTTIESPTKSMLPNSSSSSSSSSSSTVSSVSSSLVLPNPIIRPSLNADIAIGQAASLWTIHPYMLINALQRIRYPLDQLLRSKLTLSPNDKEIQQEYQERLNRRSSTVLLQTFKDILKAYKQYSDGNNSTKEGNTNNNNNFNFSIQSFLSETELALLQTLLIQVIIEKDIPWDTSSSSLTKHPMVELSGTFEGYVPSESSIHTNSLAVSTIQIYQEMILMVSDLLYHQGSEARLMEKLPRANTLVYQWSRCIMDGTVRVNNSKSENYSETTITVSSSLARFIYHPWYLSAVQSILSSLRSSSTLKTSMRLSDITESFRSLIFVVLSTLQYSYRTNGLPIPSLHTVDSSLSNPSSSIKNTGSLVLPTNGWLMTAYETMSHSNKDSKLVNPQVSVTDIEFVKNVVTQRLEFLCQLYTEQPEQYTQNRNDETSFSSSSSRSNNNYRTSTEISTPSSRTLTMNILHMKELELLVYYLWSVGVPSSHSLYFQLLRILDNHAVSTNNNTNTGSSQLYIRSKGTVDKEAYQRLHNTLRYITTLI